MTRIRPDSSRRLPTSRGATPRDGLKEIFIAQKRDVDVPLSPLGERQALALGKWFRKQRDAERPTIILISTYLLVVAHQLARDDDARGALVLSAFNHVTPIEDAGEAVTKAPDVANHPR